MVDREETGGTLINALNKRTKGQIPKEDDIDAIFTKKSKPEPIEPKATLTKKKTKKKNKKNLSVETIVLEKEPIKQELPKDDLFEDGRGLRKKTEDGLPIYLDTELNIGLGKDTEDCPFDCQCCF